MNELLEIGTLIESLSNSKNLQHKIVFREGEMIIYFKCNHRNIQGGCSFTLYSLDFNNVENLKEYLKRNINLTFRKMSI